MLDAGGGSAYQFIRGSYPTGGPNSMDWTLQRPDTRGSSGVGWDAPDPIKTPRDKIRVVQLPGTVIYVPVPTKPPTKPKRKKNRSGGGGVSGVE